MYYDISVIVDNYVEIGDFFAFYTFFVKIEWMFYSKKMQRNSFKIKKILIYSMDDDVKLTDIVLQCLYSVK